MTQLNLGNVSRPASKSLTCHANHAKQKSTPMKPQAATQIDFTIPEKLQKIGVTHAIIQQLYTDRTLDVPQREFDYIINTLSSELMDKFVNHRFTINHLSKIINGCLIQTPQILESFLMNIEFIYPLLEDTNNLGMFSRNNMATILSNAPLKDIALNINSLRHPQTVPTLKHIMSQCNLSTDQIAELLKCPSYASPKEAMYKTLNTIIKHEEKLIQFLHTNEYDTTFIKMKLRSYEYVRKQYPVKRKTPNSNDNDNHDDLMNNIPNLLPMKEKIPTHVKLPKTILDFDIDIPGDVIASIMSGIEIPPLTDEDIRAILEINQNAEILGSSTDQTTSLSFGMADA